MQTRQLNYMVEIARQQSLSGAARVLGISQPALSQFVAAEEKALGVSLFFSYQNKMYPTPAGMIYINAAAEMIRIREQTYRKIRSYKADSLKQIRIGVSDHAARKMTAKAVPAVFGHYPDAAVIPVKGTDVWLENQLRQGKLEMAVLGYDQAQIPHGGFYQFAKRELYVLIPREFKLSYPLLESSQHHEYISLEELKNFPFIFPEEDTLERRIADELFSQTGYEPNVIYTASDLYVSLELTSAGFGISFLPKRLAEQADQSKVRIFSLLQRPAAFYGVTLRQEKEPDEVEQLLICCILQEARKEEGDALLYNGESKRLMERYAGKEGYLWTQSSLNI